MFYHTKILSDVFLEVGSTNLILKGELRGDFQIRSQGEYGMYESNYKGKLNKSLTHCCEQRKKSGITSQFQNRLPWWRAQQSHLHASLWVDTGRTCLLFVSVFICFEKMGFVSAVLNWKQSWDIKGPLCRGSWRCESREQDTGQIGNRDQFLLWQNHVTSVIAKSQPEEQVATRDGL